MGTRPVTIAGADESADAAVAGDVAVGAGSCGWLPEHAIVRRTASEAYAGRIICD